MRKSSLPEALCWPARLGGHPVGVDDDGLQDLGDAVQLRRGAALEVALLATEVGVVVSASRDHGVGQAVTTAAAAGSRLHDELALGCLVEGIGDVLRETEADGKVDEDRRLAVVAADDADGKGADRRLNDAGVLARRKPEGVALQLLLQPPAAGSVVIHAFDQVVVLPDRVEGHAEMHHRLLVPADVLFERGVGVVRLQFLVLRGQSVVARLESVELANGERHGGGRDAQNDGDNGQDHSWLCSLGRYCWLLVCGWVSDSKTG